MFLKWLTDAKHNLAFCAESGYLPVTREGNSQEALDELYIERRMEPLLKSVIETGVAMTQGYELFTTKAFENGLDARNVVEASMKEQASGDYAAICELIAGGVDRNAAIAQYTTDENFNAWYDRFVEELQNTIQ